MGKKKDYWKKSQRKCEGVLIDKWIRKSILDKKVYNLTGSSSSNVSFQTFQGRKKMEMSSSWPPYALSHVSLLPPPNTHHWPPSSVSAFRQETAAPNPCAIFFPFNNHQARFIKESTLAGDRSTQLGLPLSISPPALGTEQPGWRSCYTLVQEMPSARRPPQWCFSKWAQKNILYMAAEVHHSCHRNIRTQPGLEVDSGSGGRLGKWPKASLTCPWFPLGKGIPGLAWPEIALRCQTVPGSIGIHSSQMQLTQEDANSVNWVCQGLVASLDFFEVTGICPTSSKSSRSLVIFYATANGLPGKGEIRGATVSILYLLPCLLPLSPPPLTSPPTSHASE